MADQEQTPHSQEDLRIRAVIAHLLWMEDASDAVPKEVEARAAAFEGHKVDYKKKASRLIRKLQARGVALSLATEDV